ncbi:MAG: DUF5110 domain-containing protein [Phycisphaerales bacterium]|nr:MAG: DUF5110 domain-containing protein [Phycisphaerales bacterium]
MASGLAEAQVALRLDRGVQRFDHSAEARENALPSISFIEPERRERGEAVTEGGWAVRPEFSTDDDGRYVARIPLQAGTSLYGTGEVPGQLLRNGRVTETWNTDAYAYNNNSLSLYQSHPYVLAVRADGTAFGVIADTTYRCRIETRDDAIVFAAEGRAFPLIVIDGATPQEVTSKLAELTGYMPMPPKWAIGYHQCRYSYYPESVVRELAEGFRKRNIPCDVIWMDIDYMDGFRTFTFSDEHFPDPKGLNDWLLSKGFHNVWMINPGVKDEEGYFVRDQLVEGDHAVKRADGSTFRGEVWPGPCLFPDFTRRETREWWATLYQDFIAQNVTGVWNDMNEPAIFNVESKTMPEDNVHRADEALGGEGNHQRYHNIYGMQMVSASRDGIQAAAPDRRVFVLSRANFLGGHRYAATWSGDNVADWDHLEWSVSMTLNLGLSGQPFNGPDIGGFAGNGTAEMFRRWMAVGAMMPFARGHTGKGNIDKEPWSFGAEVEATSRRALERRYVMLPYFYTLFREAATTGLPVMRPVFFADPADPALRSEDDAFLLGSGVLVVPFMTPEADRVFALPKGDWRRFDFAHKIDGDSEDEYLPEMYLKAGSILPTGPVKQYVGERPLDELTLIVALDNNGRASGTLYEDDGDGHAYREGGFRLTEFRASLVGDIVTVTSRVAEGDWAPAERRVHVRIIHEDGRVTTGTERSNRPIRIELRD